MRHPVKIRTKTGIPIESFPRWRWEERHPVADSVSTVIVLIIVFVALWLFVAGGQS